jgi:hypothetical protein
LTVGLEACNVYAGTALPALPITCIVEQKIDINAPQAVARTSDWSRKDQSSDKLVGK